MTYDEQWEEVEVVGVAGVLGVDPDAAADEGVLPHENDGVPSEPLADVLRLVGPHIVGGGDEHLAVLVQKTAQPLVVVLLLLSLRHLDGHYYRWVANKNSEEQKKEKEKRGRFTKFYLTKNPNVQGGGST